MTIIVVAAVAANGVIGAGGDLAWRNSDDLRRLKGMTMGHTLIMGRRNFDSIGRPLPGRRTIVLTRRSDWAHDDVIVAGDVGGGLDTAMAKIVADTGDDVFFVFGGGEIYAQLLDRSDVLELTEIDAELPGDVSFPPIDRHIWQEHSREERNGYAWVRYERAAAAGTEKDSR